MNHHRNGIGVNIVPGTEQKPNRRRNVEPARPVIEAIEGRLMLSTTWIVNTLLDEANPGPGLTSLREAIGAAKSGDAIDFASSLTSSGSKTMTLDGSEMLIDVNVAINGPGASKLTIDGAGQSRIFEIAASASDSINGLTLTNGEGGQTSADAGGAILNQGTLSLSNDILTNNKCYAGGALMNLNALTAANCTISENAVDYQGGGIYNAARCTLSHVTLTGNKCTETALQGSGGGLFNIGGIMGSGQGILIATNSTFTSNSAFYGGGINNYGNGSTITLNDCTLNGNTATQGGAINVGLDGPTTLNQCTITGNAATDTTGGAIDSETNVSLNGCTITSNTAVTGGGAIHMNTSYGTATVQAKDTIVSSNTAAGNPNDVSGSFTSSSSYNFVGVGGGLTNGVNGNIVGVTDPVLGPLQNNGGPMLTQMPLPGSPVIDAGDPSYTLTTSPTTDQRGYPRVTDGNGDGIARIDIGAVESPADTLLVNGDFSSGRTGFSTQYQNAKVPGGMIVANNPTVFSTGFSSFPDHTTGKGLMLIADGSETPNQYVWEESVKVAASQDYIFSGWAASAGQYPIGTHTDPSPARLAVYVNGAQIGGAFTVAAKNGVWGNFSGFWHSTSNATVTIKIVDLNTTFVGNDFVLDDLRFLASPNLLANGNFSAGNNGFTSQYTNSANPGGYIIGHNPHVDFGPGFASFGDHTTGSGLMLMADGAITGILPAVWEETVSVGAGDNYDFSGFSASMDIGTDPSPARLAFYVNGVQIGGFNVGSTGGKWGQFSSLWSSGSSTKATIKIVDLNQTFVGNDFVLDDLAFVRT